MLWIFLPFSSADEIDFKMGIGLKSRENEMGMDDFALWRGFGIEAARQEKSIHGRVDIFREMQNRERPFQSTLLKD